MGVDFTHQLYVALGAALVGMGISLFFVLMRVAGQFMHGTFWRFVLDFSRVVVASFGAFLYFRYVSDGQIRWYDIGMLLLAAWLFYLCFGRFLVKVLCRLISFLAELFKKIWTLIWYPLAFVLRFFSKTVRFIAKIVLCFLKKVFIFLKKYIIMIPYPIFLKRKKLKEAPDGNKAEEKTKRDISQFYH